MSLYNKNIIFTKVSFDSCKVKFTVCRVSAILTFKIPTSYFMYINKLILIFIWKRNTQNN